MPQEREANAGTDAGTDAARALWTELEDHLQTARRSILAEIRNYPPPIAACDQQFNYLLEQRDRVARELSRLASLADRSAPETDLEALADFISTSACIGEELKAHLTQRLDRQRAART